MAVRQQTGEVRAQRVFITDDDGVPATGLTPTAVARHGDTGALLTAPMVEELGDGFYRVLTGALPADTVVRIDRGTAGAGRYIALEVVVGGYVDSVDATITSRASSASVTALGSPAQAAALVAVSQAIDDLHAAVGNPAQASAYTTARAALLDNLSRLDVAVSTRATPAQITTAPPPQIQSGP